MNIDIEQRSSHDVPTIGGGETPPCAGLISNALPEAQCRDLAESSQTGVSTRNVLSATANQLSKQKASPQWYVLRTTYGRERMAYEYLTAQGVKVFYPTQRTLKDIGGKHKFVTESLIPNILFAYGTFDRIKSFVYDNVNLPYLRFYYRYINIGRRTEKIPITVPDYQMESFKIICSVDGHDTILSFEEIPKFKSGQLVRIIHGTFEGVIGRIARYQGQQRVAVIIDGIISALTAYVPTCFCEMVEEK